ncbi:unnamed protein product [Periconia digitata]|uniref:Transfer RNA methyltransferase 82 n=1 Tax=Periconia digitata TaxID=1303443 RepID=A0A9W4XP49_9PLEO|nr:unnamed protein product [Periconia digitata]
MNQEQRNSAAQLRMAFPYKCLAACTRLAADGEDWALFGASGSTLVVQSSRGTQSTWSTEQNVENKPDHGDESVEGPSGKRIKLSHPTHQKNNFSSIKISNDGKYLIAITAEDKSIRVFQLSSDWQLRQLSERCMTRRPCSITLSDDNSTIFCADKFGDVYALPLLPSPEDERNANPHPEDGPKKYAPSASLSTVHSGRNRKVLEEQLKQAAKGRPQPKDAPTFKHDLLLGHVSMLTDVVTATVGSRSYLITADRDEHIRVSRSVPQAHIIEGFCHGHEEFVHRLCMSNSNRLISGGGDTHLYVWDWLSHTLLEKIPLQSAVLNLYRNQSGLNSLVPEREEDFRIAVSGIWNVPSRTDETDEILVACEGVPALFKIKPETPSEEAQTLVLNGNALDVTFVTVAGANTAIVSIDHVHEPGHTTKTRENQEPSRLQLFTTAQNGEWFEDDRLKSTLEWFSQDTVGGQDTGESARVAFGKEVQGVIYGVENLRKRAEIDAAVSV